MRETIVITGGSGLVGALLLDRFLDRDVRLLVTTHDTAMKLRRGRAGVETVRCDLSRRHFGLPRWQYRRLAAETTAILHCAGRTGFGASRDEARSANVLAVENILAFSAEAPRIRRIAILSTIYVAGKRRGSIDPGELTHRSGFVNEYERSKYEAEQMARHAMPRVPISVYRLSTILCSRDGAVRRLAAVHHALRLFHAGLLPLVPGEPESDVDLISSEYATEAVDTLFEHFEPGTSHHIAAGSRDRIRLDRFLALTAELLARYDPRWVERSVETPPIVPLATFQRLRRMVEAAGDPVLSEVMRLMQSFAPQLAFPKQFKDESTRSILRSWGVEEDRFASIYPRFIQNAVDTRWGKRKQPVAL